MSKGSATRPVYDFLLSVDYGGPHGRLDSINQIWVKDKPILCGQYTQNAIETVYIPDRFGGDDAEGGVAGVVELYMGTDDQVASEALAFRFGETSETWPGYVGVSHIFFRGATSGAAEVLTPGGPDELDGTEYSRDNGAGFVWSSNNPYFPEVKVHVTRFPDGLLGFESVIPATTGVIIDGDDVSLVLANNGYEILIDDNYEFGSEESFDDFLTARSAFMFAWAANSLRLSNNTFASPGGWPPNDWVHPSADSGAAAEPVDSTLDWYGGNDGHAILNANFTGKTGLAKSDGTTAVYLANLRQSTINPELLTDGVGESYGDSFFDTANYNLEDNLVEYFGYSSVTEIDAGRGIMILRPRVKSGVGTTSFSFRIGIYCGATKAAKTTTLFSWSGGGGSNTDITRYVMARIPPGARWIRIEKEGSAFTDIISAPTTDGSSAKVDIWSGIGEDLNFLVGRWSNTEPEYAYCQPNGDLNGFPDANPAAMIYEILTNDEWGKGEDPANIDSASFSAAATTLISERMGMSQVWVKQDTIENLVQDILDHIKAFLFINPMTGLYQLKLLRADYDPEAVPVLNETNCKAKKRKRRAWGETINEIVVSYTDPNTEEAATVSAQDDGNIALQGSIVSETREYSGFRNPFIAQFVADRDVREAAYPVFSCVIEVDRSFWNTVPGDVFRFSWDADDISEMIVRVMSVNYGKPKSRKILLNVSEDIFGLDQTTYGDVPGSLWTPEETDPDNFDWQLIPDIPLPMLQRNGITVDEVDANYPSQGVMFLGAHEFIDAIDFEVWTAVSDGVGGTAPGRISTVAPTKTYYGALPFPPEAESRVAVAIIDYLTFGLARPGDVFMIGYDEYNHELVMLDYYDSGTEEWVVIRGLWDTTPYDWISYDEYLTKIPMDGTNFDPTPRTEGESRSYRFLPRTTFGRLPYASAYNWSITVGERAHRPFRPANCQLDGQGFDTLFLADVLTPGQMTATWVNRNRTMEDNTVMRWDDGNVTPEAGQTTTITVREPTSPFNTIVEYSGLTGTSQVIPFASLGGFTTGWVRFKSVNAIGESLYNSFRYFDIN